MKFLVPNYSCLQNPWLGGCRPQILSVLCPQLNLLKPPPEQNIWLRHWLQHRAALVVGSRLWRDLPERNVGSYPSRFSAGGGGDACIITRTNWLSGILRHRGYVPPWRLNSVRLRLAFVGLQYGAGIVSPFWFIALWGSSLIFGKVLYPWA